MPFQIDEREACIRVSNAAWQIEHLRAAGGAWSSIRFTNGSATGLLQRPLNSAVRFVKSDPGSESGVYTAFCEANEPHPRMRVEHIGEVTAVIAEGTYRNEKGEPIPVGYRRRTEYHEHGLIWTTLELMSDSGCDEVVEVRALEMFLRAGMSNCFVRFHPTQAGGSDLLGGRAWYDLNALVPDATGQTQCATPFLSRYTPLQIMCCQRGVEGIELFPGSELSQWDCSLKPEIGLGLYRVEHSGAGTTIELSPYCMALRRIKVKLQGTLAFRLGIGLPLLAPREHALKTVCYSPASSGSRWASDDDIGKMASAGVELIRFQNDYCEDGTFWRNGMYRPYDEAYMSELKRVVDTVHRHGMKIVPYISLKEFHPGAPGYARHSNEWMHMAAPSLDIIHNWAGSGEYGGLMCMKSGWLEFRKHSVDRILAELPWDGLYLDWTTFFPCCHPGHGRGPFHSDLDGFLDFLFFCRKRLGPAGVLVVNLSGVPSFIAENLANWVYILEDKLGLFGATEPLKS